MFHHHIRLAVLIKIASLFACASFISIAKADSFSESEIFSKLKKKLSTVGNIDEQSACYVNQNAEVVGVNINQKRDLASVSKLLTTFFALANWGEQYQFKTTLYIFGNKGYLQGDLDPIFGTRRVYDLISQLNKLGITKLSQLFYDKKVIIKDSIMSPSSATQVYGLDPEELIKSSGKQLMALMNTAKWSESKKSEFQKWSAAYPRISKKINFRLEESNLTSTTSQRAAAQKIKLNYQYKIEIFSESLSEIVKLVNVFSHNPISDLLYYRAQNNSSFKKFYEKYIPGFADTFEFYSGSGLPVYDQKELKAFFRSQENLRSLELTSSDQREGDTLAVDEKRLSDFEDLEFSVAHNELLVESDQQQFENLKKSRKTNRSNCVGVLKILELWSKFSAGERPSEILGFQYPSEIIKGQRAKNWIAVSGREGTIKGRYLDLKNQFLAKTGTLRDTSNLSGSLMTEKGQVHFSIMNHFVAQQEGKVDQSRKIQRSIVDDLFLSFDGAAAFDYRLSRINSEVSWFGTKKVLIETRRKTGPF
ncbi:MAG: D-alanyl-D-alanine carboxypeptidase [Bacteriovoracaceae bacterium]|nr:D-alanyl-D-alanine carboxypeptidase [Bacteriovoracaceae bacterium]